MNIGSVSEDRSAFAILVTAGAIAVMVASGLALVTCTGSASLCGPALVPLVVVPLVGGALLAAYTARRDADFLAVVFGIGFLFRVATAFVVSAYLAGGPFAGFEGNDDLYWDAKGWEVAQTNDYANALGGFSGGYVVLTAAAYELAGHDPLAPRIVNAAMGALVAVVAYHLADALGASRRTARTSMWAVALTPTFVFFSALHQKDVVLALGVTLGVLAILRLTEREAVGRWAATFALALAITSSIRPLAAHLLLGALAFAFVLGRVRSSHLTVSAKQIALFAAGLLVVQFVLAAAGIVNLLDFSAHLDRVQYVREDLARAGPGGLSSVLRSAPPAVAVLVGVFIFFVSPFPPMLDIHRDFAATVMSVASPPYLLLLPFLFAAPFTLRGEMRQKAVVAAVPILGIALVSGFFYLGTIARHRVMVEPLILVIAVLTFQQASPERRTLGLAAAAAVAVTLTVSYLLARAVFL